MLVNCTRNALLSGIVTLLPPSGTVLEILEDVCADPELLACCHALKAQGYRFALDDFTSNGVTTGFSEIADFIKVDFRSTDADARHASYNLLDRKHQICIAEKVETMEEVEQARNEACVFFQGYVFSSRIVSQLTDIARNDELYLSLLSLLSREKIDILRVAQLTESDDALSSRLWKTSQKALIA